MAKETQMLKGILEGCTLAILSNNETYGYKVVEKLREYGFDDIQEATVYPLLTRLNKKNLLTFTKRPSEMGPPRKYYQLTDEGRQALSIFNSQWNNISSKVDTILNTMKYDDDRT